MPQDTDNPREVDLMPMGQRIAWMAFVWTLSVTVLAFVAVGVWTLIG